ncbi:MAG: hypothetical protein KJN80_04585 [Deltaproteobacteria bacterium]|nr:hypothetical protein [Deltaproteobacteria bacterium]NNK85843.1 hypothetical protein [Desulfobacterales bacterium]
MKIMGIFWLLAEGLVMFYMRKGFIFLKKGEARQRKFIFFCVSVFLLLFCLNFAQEFNLDRYLAAKHGSFGQFYYSYLWNFFCTLWVVIEAAIVIYVFKIYDLLRIAIEKKKSILNQPLLFGSGIFFLFLFLLYAMYHYYLGSMVDINGFHRGNIQNLFNFYIKICGVFWILIEWTVGLIGLKIFFLLKRRI